MLLINHRSGGNKKSNNFFFCWLSTLVLIMKNQKSKSIYEFNPYKVKTMSQMQISVLKFYWRLHKLGKHIYSISKKS